MQRGARPHPGAGRRPEPHHAWALRSHGAPHLGQCPAASASLPFTLSSLNAGFAGGVRGDNRVYTGAARSQAGHAWTHVRGSLAGPKARAREACRPCDGPHRPRFALESELASGRKEPKGPEKHTGPGFSLGRRQRLTLTVTPGQDGTREDTPTSHVPSVRPCRTSDRGWSALLECGTSRSERERPSVSAGLARSPANTS